MINLMTSIFCHQQAFSQFNTAFINSAEMLKINSHSDLLCESQPTLQTRLNKLIQIPVQHRLGIACFHTGAQVFNA